MGAFYFHLRLSLLGALSPIFNLFFTTMRARIVLFKMNVEILS